MPEGVRSMERLGAATLELRTDRARYELVD
jgi:hypothetical protein